MTYSLSESKGIDFIRESSLNRRNIRELKRPGIGISEPFKEYPGAEKIILPRTSWRLAEARIQPLLQQRRSVRRYSSESVKLVDLAFVLWASQGVTAKAGKQLLRTTPSAGALYPVETYVSVQNVEGLDAGLYHLDARTFQLERLENKQKARELAAVCLDQAFIEQASFCLLWSAVTRRSVSKYGDRGMRYIFMDAAHICQGALLAAEAIDCGGCPIAAFYDEEMCELLDIDGVEEVPIYAASFGRKIDG